MALQDKVVATIGTSNTGKAMALYSGLTDIGEALARKAIGAELPQPSRLEATRRRRYDGPPIGVFIT